MKRLLIVTTLILTCTCASKTEFGDCIGINGNEKADLKYDYSIRNIVVGVIFSEMLLIPPILVLMNQTKCPVAKK